MHCSRCTVFSQSILRLLWANSGYHLSRFPCLFRVLMTPSLTLAGPDVLHMLVPCALSVSLSLSLSSWDVFELHISLRVCCSSVEFEQPVCHFPFPFELVTLHCSRCTVFSQSILCPYLGQQRSTPFQKSDFFRVSRDPITFARRARCPAHVGSHLQ